MPPPSTPSRNRAAPPPARATPRTGWAARPSSRVADRVSRVRSRAAVRRRSTLRQTQRMAQHFEGVIGRDWRDSTPWWPEEPAAPRGAPNVLLIVLDDVGYAQLGCYGSDIATPTIDALAADGIRLANFHTTALCSPTRSCLLTG